MFKTKQISSIFLSSQTLLLAEPGAENSVKVFIFSQSMRAVLSHLRFKLG